MTISLGIFSELVLFTYMYIGPSRGRESGQLPWSPRFGGPHGARQSSGGTELGGAAALCPAACYPTLPPRFASGLGLEWGQGPAWADLPQTLHPTRVASVCIHQSWSNIKNKHHADSFLLGISAQCQCWISREHINLKD